MARTPGLLGLCAAYFCVKLVRYTLLFWLPLYLHEHLGFTAPQAGFAATLFDVEAGAVRLIKSARGPVRPADSDAWAGTGTDPQRGRI